MPTVGGSTAVAETVHLTSNAARRIQEADQLFTRKRYLHTLRCIFNSCKHLRLASSVCGARAPMTYVKRSTRPGFVRLKRAQSGWSSS